MIRIAVHGCGRTGVMHAANRPAPVLAEAALTSMVEGRVVAVKELA